jgi:hypothetical protein
LHVRLYTSGTNPAPLADAGQPDAGVPRQWWRTRYGRWRLSVEKEAMRRHFPRFSPVEAYPGGWRGWLGWLHSALPDGGRYQVRITYPENFPEEAPVVQILQPDLTGSAPHMLSEGRPCLYLPTQGPRHGYDPQRTTAATLVAWTALWIHAYETWRSTDTWPGRGE